MKSNQMDVGMSSIQAYKATQTRRNTGKQGAQTRGTHSAHLPKHPYINGCMIIVGYANIQGYKKLKKKTAWLL